MTATKPPSVLDVGAQKGKQYGTCLTSPSAPKVLWYHCTGQPRSGRGLGGSLEGGALGGDGAGESGRRLCPVCRVRKAHSRECEGERAAGNEEVGVAGPVPGRGVSREKHSL